MYHPIGLLTLGSSTFVEHKGLLHPNKNTTVEDLLVFACSLPVAGISCSVCSQASRILSVSQAEEVPFFLPHACLCYNIQTNPNVYIIKIRKQIKCVAVEMLYIFLMEHYLSLIKIGYS